MKCTFYWNKECYSIFCCHSELRAPVDHRDRGEGPNGEKNGARSPRNETGLSSSTRFQIQKRVRLVDMCGSWKPHPGRQLAKQVGPGSRAHRCRELEAEPREEENEDSRLAGAQWGPPTSATKPLAQTHAQASTVGKSLSHSRDTEAAGWAGRGEDTNQSEPRTSR